MSKIEDRVIQQIRDRAGHIKLENNDKALEEWVQELQEELMDACVYLEKIKQEIQYLEFELAQKKMEIIGNDVDNRTNLNALGEFIYKRTIS